MYHLQKYFIIISIRRIKSAKCRLLMMMNIGYRKYMIILIITLFILFMINLEYSEDVHSPSYIFKYLICQSIWTSLRLKIHRNRWRLRSLWIHPRHRCLFNGLINNNIQSLKNMPYLIMNHVILFYCPLAFHPQICPGDVIARPSIVIQLIICLIAFYRKIFRRCPADCWSHQSQYIQDPPPTFPPFFVSYASQLARALLFTDGSNQSLILHGNSLMRQPLPSHFPGVDPQIWDWALAEYNGDLQSSARGVCMEAFPVVPGKFLNIGYGFLIYGLWHPSLAPFLLESSFLEVLSIDPGNSHSAPLCNGWITKGTKALPATLWRNTWTSHALEQTVIRVEEICLPINISLKFEWGSLLPCRYCIYLSPAIGRRKELFARRRTRCAATSLLPSDVIDWVCVY